VTAVGRTFRYDGYCWSYMGRFTSPYIPEYTNVTLTTISGNYFASAPTISYSSCSACVPVVENIKINWFFNANNGAYNSNITNPNLTMTATTSSGSIVKLNTNSLGNGTFNTNEGIIDISASFVYANNFSGAKILRISAGSPNNLIEYGDMVVGQPSVGTTYKLTGTGYFAPNVPTNSTYNIIVTITIY
jgi:hypothetical protein